MAKIGVGVIGLGWPGVQHLKGYRAWKDADLVALCDINVELLRKIAKEYDVKKTYRDYREMLKNDAVQAVSVCLPNYLHHPVTIACLKAGRHVICEKPPALNASQAQEMANTAKTENRVLMYALMQRFGAESSYLKTYVESGDLGEIYFGETAYVRRRGIPIGSGGWFVDRDRSGGGALIDIGVHALDLAWWLMGNPKPTAVSGLIYQKFASTVPRSVKYTVDDAAFALIRFATGASLILKTTWALNLKSENYTRIAGAEGGASLPPLTVYTERRNAQIDISPQLPEINAFDREIVHFIQCVQERKTPIPSAEQGVTLMQMLDSVYASSTSGKELLL